MLQSPGLQEMNVYTMNRVGSVAQTVEVTGGASGGGWGHKKEPPLPPPLVPQPEKISVSATVQCAFQIL